MYFFGKMRQIIQDNSSFCCLSFRSWERWCLCLIVLFWFNEWNKNNNKIKSTLHASVPAYTKHSKTLGKTRWGWTLHTLAISVHSTCLTSCSESAPHLRCPVLTQRGCKHRFLPLRFVIIYDDPFTLRQLGSIGHRTCTANTWGGGRWVHSSAGSLLNRRLELGHWQTSKQTGRQTDRQASTAPEERQVSAEEAFERWNQWETKGNL